jgi:prepilin-type N-terminal cleavage/methylation domain-containing protein
VKHERQTPCRGFTLIEVLVSVAVALITLSALPVTLRITGDTTIFARDGTAALGLAQAKLEELIGAHASGTAGEDAVTVPGTATTFVRAWEAEPSATSGSAWRLSTTVRWAGGRHQITLRTSAWKP